MKIGAGIMGHRPSKLFIITTDGRIDNFVARIVLWVSAHTWGRWTRWLPQNLVTIATMCYFVGGMVNLYITNQWRGWGAINVALFVGVSAFLEWQSYMLRGLSGHMTEVSLAEILLARRAAGGRAIAGPIVAFTLFGLALTPNAEQVTSLVTLTAWMWAMYTVTMGRTLPPKKAKERRWRLNLSLPRLPRLVPTRS